MPGISKGAFQRQHSFCGITTHMRKFVPTLGAVVLLSVTALAQGKRLWVLRASGELVEYDSASFAQKQTVKLPAEAGQAPQEVQVNSDGQILYVPEVSLPLADSDIKAPPKAWLWNGHAAVEIDLGVKHDVESTGSNQAVTETAPSVYLSLAGNHLYWFANQERRLEREDVDLSATTTWQAWQTDLNGGNREDVASVKLPECSCPTGACEESCPVGTVWAPEHGIESFFLMTQFVSGKDQPSYKASAQYRQDGGKWTQNVLSQPLRRILDVSADAGLVVEAIPDTGCCGWSNQSDDQTLVRASGKTFTVFDELASYKNPDYDVSFYTSNAKLTPDNKSIAMTIVATAQSNQPIQQSQQGQANPEESRQIRKALTELPAVEIKSVEEAPRRIAFLPHATLVGWINEKDLLIVENHLLVVYEVGAGVKRKSNVSVDEASAVFLR